MMPTKKEEREALEKIKKILEGLGNKPENSYVVRAFEGCVEDAESNIENDFGDSWKERAEHEKNRAESANIELQRRMNEKRELEDEIKALKVDNEELRKKRTEDASIKTEMEKGLVNAWKEIEAAKAENNELKMKVIELKAKLYDYMVGDVK